MKKLSLYVVTAILIVVVAVMAFAQEGGVTLTAEKRMIPVIDVQRNGSFETATFSLG